LNFAIRRGLAVLLGLIAMLGLSVLPAAASAAKKPQPVPMIFVHGNSGSAQQFETNAMRFVSNGFPQNRIFTLEYDTSLATNDHAIEALGRLVDTVRSKTDAPKVNLLAHSRGTLVSQSWLTDSAENAAKVNKYVNFDGAWASSLPGGVPTMAVWAEAREPFPADREIVGGVNRNFPEKSHTEVVNSRGAFRAVYEFLLGKKPKTLNVVPEAPNKVTVKGRALNFPANTGIDGGTLRVFPLNAKTGQRKGRAIYVKKLDQTGNFGPLKVNGRTRYEFAVTRPGTTTLHNYPEPFERDNHLYRVLIAPALAPFLDASPAHTNVSVTRMFEFRGDQPGAGANDRLLLNGRNVITPGTSPRVRRTLAVFNIDRGSDGVTDTSTSLSPFNLLSFLTGVDIFLPAAADHGGTIKVTEKARRPFGHTRVTNIPNWPSSDHSVSVYFKNYPDLKYKQPKKKKQCRNAKKRGAKKKCAR
jgi:Predicted acetyltransferases and hydrolases with the alpha/beta hydrolase fold